MDHGYQSLESKFINDIIRWYAYDGSVGGLESVISENKYVYKAFKRVLDMREPRGRKN